MLRLRAKVILSWIGCHRYFDLKFQNQWFHLDSVLSGRLFLVVERKAFAGVVAPTSVRCLSILNSRASLRKNTITCYGRSVGRCGSVAVGRSLWVGRCILGEWESPILARCFILMTLLDCGRGGRPGCVGPVKRVALNIILFSIITTLLHRHTLHKIVRLSVIPCQWQSYQYELSHVYISTFHL